MEIGYHKEGGESLNFGNIFWATIENMSLLFTV